MKLLILFSVFWQMLNCSAYTHSGNPTASGVMPAVGHCAADHLPFGSKVILPDGTALTVQTDLVGTTPIGWMCSWIRNKPAGTLAGGGLTAR